MSATEEKIKNLIIEFGDDGVLDLSELNLRWAFWDDDEDWRDDDNALYCEIRDVRLGTLGVLVNLEGRKLFGLYETPFEDGDELPDWLYEEIYSHFNHFGTEFA